MLVVSNPPACLENFIVLRDGCYCDENGAQVPTPTPTSGFYIESLSGITVENISDIVNESNRTATNLVNNMVYMAAYLVEAQVKALLNESGLNLNKIGKESNLCNVYTSFSNQAIGVDKGIRISKSAIASPQSKIKINSIKFKSKISGSTTLKIIDGQTNALLWSSNAVAVADQLITVPVGLQFDATTLYITADATNLKLYEWTCAGECGCCGDLIKGMTGGKELAVIGFDGTQYSMVGFVGVCAQVNCTDENIICRFSDRLKLAILYQTGIGILEEWLSPSSRLNFIKLNSQDWAIAQLEKFQAMTADLIRAEIGNIKQILHQDKYCFDCTNRFQNVVMLP